MSRKTQTWVAVVAVVAFDGGGGGVFLVFLILFYFFLPFLNLPFQLETSFPNASLLVLTAANTSDVSTT